MQNLINLLLVSIILIMPDCRIKFNSVYLKKFPLTASDDIYVQRPLRTRLTNLQMFRQAERSSMSWNGTRGERVHSSTVSRWEPVVSTLHRGGSESTFLVRNSSIKLQKWSCEVWSWLTDDPSGLLWTPNLLPLSITFYFLIRKVDMLEYGYKLLWANG